MLNSLGLSGSGFEDPVEASSPPPPESNWKAIRVVSRSLKMASSSPNSRWISVL
jgi:hypothetical protein